MTKQQLYLRVLAKQWREMGHKTAADVLLHIANNADDFAARRRDDLIKTHTAASTPAHVAERFKSLQPGEPMVHARTAATGKGYFVNFGATHDGGETYHSFGGYFSPKDTATLLHRMAKEGTANAAETMADNFGSDANPGRRPKLDTSEPAEEGIDWRPNETIPEDYYSYSRKLRYAAPAWWPRTGWGGRPGKEPITHERVNAWLGKKNEKQLSRNRKVWRDHTGDIHLRLHYTNIVTWHPDGSYTLNTGGWHSPTTARNMAAVIGLPVRRVNKRGQPPQLGVLGKPIVDGAKWEPVMPPAPEQDWRPDSVIPEDHYSLSRRKRKYARYSQVAKHPDVLGLMARLDDDTGMHGVLADRIEEAGFPGIALHIRESGHKDPYGNGWPFSTSDLYRHLGGLLEAGQPVAVWYPAQSRESGGMGHVHLFVPAGDGRYRRWSSPRLSRPQMAARLRSLSHDGVAISPGGARLLNTDESAAKRSRRKRRFARYSEVAQHPEVLGLVTSSPGPAGDAPLADRIEELGFPAIAKHIWGGTRGPGKGPIDWDGYHPDQSRPHDPYVEVQRHGPSGWYRARLHLPGEMETGPDGQKMTSHMWTSGLMTEPEAAGHVQSLVAEGANHSPGVGRWLAATRPAEPTRKYAQKKPRTADFLTAVRVLRGSGQKRLHAVAEDIARGLGLSPAKTRDALLDGPRGALPGVAQAVAGADPHTARYAAAWYGLLARTPSLGLFHVRPDGPDSLYKFHVRGSAHTARRVLDRHGIAARVLLPHGAGYDVVVPDPGRRLRANTLKAAGHLGGRVEESVGHLEPLGHADPAQARSAFRKIVERYEGGRR